MSVITIDLEGAAGDHWSALKINDLLDAVADHGLVAACAVEGMPKRRTVLGWAREFPAFKAALDAAQSDFAQYLVDDALACADLAEDSQSASAAKVRADARFRAAALIAPSVYGKADRGVDTGGLVVQLVRLAAQGLASTLQTVESIDLKGSTVPILVANATHSQPIDNKNARENEGVGTPRDPGPPLSPGPANDFGENPRHRIPEDYIPSTITLDVDDWVDPALIFSTFPT